MTLREARKRHSITQKDLAAIVGISIDTVSNIENYRTFPQRKTRERLQKIFENEIEFYSASVLEGMITRFIGLEPKTSVPRARMLKAHIDKVVECVYLNIRNFKTIRR